MYKNKVEIYEKIFFKSPALLSWEEKKEWDLQKHFSCSLPYFYIYLPWILPIIECKVVGYFVLVLFGKNFNITSCCWAFFKKTRESWFANVFSSFFLSFKFCKKKCFCSKSDVRMMIFLMMLFFSLYQAKMGGVSP